MTYLLKPGHLSLKDIRETHEAFRPIALDEAARPAIAASAATIEAIVAKGEPAYGINTGFGKLAKVQIPLEQLEALQANLVRSHAVGVGPLLDDATVRVIFLLKLSSLARGCSGVRMTVIDTLIAIYNAQIWPCIPSQGSVGASGDLSPLAHLTLPLMGEGEVRVNGQVMPAAQALRAAGIEPVKLAAKEGLALLNGTQTSTGIALVGLFAAEQVYAAGVVTGALTIDAAKGSDAPFDPRIHEVRGHQGQIDVARHIRGLLSGSAIRASHLVGDERVQDPYCLRCQPQVMGAVLDQIRHAARILETEANAVSDNPLVFADTGEVISGGNFHAEPVAFAADILSMAVSEIGALSERRVAMLIDASCSNLPAFLVKEAGVNSGFMIAHVTAAALASENKTLAHPAVVDSLPTSANQEDHVSMATWAARKLVQITDNVRHIVAVELLAAAQGIEFHRPLRSSDVLEQVHAHVRSVAQAYDEDRYFAPDIHAAERLLRRDVLTGMVQDLLPSRA